MNSNNYIRKIDDLGRIVIPKEIRNRLKILDNENILLTIEEDKLYIKKYSYLNNYTNLIKEVCEIISEVYKIRIEITDSDNIIFSNLEYKDNIQISDIIKDSIVIGKIKTENIEDHNLIKFLSKIIPLFLSNY